MWLFCFYSLEEGTSFMIPLELASRWDNRGDDLRDKVDRRISVEQRYSPGRDARSRQTFSGYSASRSFEKKSDRKPKERQKLDGQSNYHGSMKVTDEIEGRAREGKNTVSNAKNVLEEQLKEVQLDINMVDQRKLQLGIYIEEKVQEADSLTSRIQELEAQLDKEKEECKRSSSKIKKFVKAHDRFSRIQDELKRSQARLQKLGDQLGSDTTRTEGNEEDLSINIVSDAETTGHRVLNPRNEMQNSSSLSKKRLRVNRDTAEKSIADAMVTEGGEDQTEIVRFKKHSRWDMHPVQSNVVKEVMVVNNGHTNHEPLGKEAAGFWVRASIAVDEVVGIDEKIEVVEIDAAGPEGGATYKATGLPFSIPPPRLVSRNSCSQYEGDDDNVDVDGLDEMVDVDII